MNKKYNLYLNMQSLGLYDGIDNVIYRMWGIESIIGWEGLNDSKSLIITIVNNNKNIYNYDIIKTIIEIPI